MSEEKQDDEQGTIIIPEHIKQRIRYNSINAFAGQLFESYVYYHNSVQMLLSVYDQDRKTYPIRDLLKKKFGNDYERKIARLKAECNETMYKMNVIIGVLKDKQMTDTERKKIYKKVLNSIYNQDDLKENCELSHEIFYEIIIHTDLANLSIPKYEIDIARETGDLSKTQQTYLEE